jgi:hypothetical protein
MTAITAVIAFRLDGYTRTAPAADVGQSMRNSIDDYRLSLHAAGKSKSTPAVYTLALAGDCGAGEISQALLHSLRALRDLSRSENAEPCQRRVRRGRNRHRQRVSRFGPQRHGQPSKSEMRPRTRPPRGAPQSTLLAWGAFWAFPAAPGRAIPTVEPGVHRR